jgi:hypothetical protein
MTRWNQRQIAHKLAEPPAAEPPADLLERLLEDIPAQAPEADPTEASPDGDEVHPVVAPLPPRSDRASRRGWSPRWLAAAAALLMMVGGGLLTVHLQRRGLSPDTSVFEETSVFDEAGAPVTETRSDQQPPVKSAEGSEESLRRSSEPRQPAGVAQLQGVRVPEERAEQEK